MSFCRCQWGEAQSQCSRLKLVDLIVKPWQHLTKYKLLLYAMRKPLDKMEPSPDVDEQRNDITVMVVISVYSTHLDFFGGFPPLLFRPLSPPFRPS